MQANGYTIADGQGVMQYARCIKNEDEIALLKHGAAIVDAAFHRIAMEIRPGAKENDLQAVAAHEPTPAPEFRPLAAAWRDYLYGYCVLV